MKAAIPLKMGSLRVIDARDEVDAEKIGTSSRVELAALGFKPGWQISQSGRCCRGEGATSTLESLATEATKLQETWEGATGSVNKGHGGTAHYRPVAIVLCNYGGNVAHDPASERITYFD